MYQITQSITLYLRSRPIFIKLCTISIHSIAVRRHLPTADSCLTQRLKCDAQKYESSWQTPGQCSDKYSNPARPHNYVKAQLAAATNSQSLIQMKFISRYLTTKSALHSSSCWLSSDRTKQRLTTKSTQSCRVKTFSSRNNYTASSTLRHTYVEFLGFEKSAKCEVRRGYTRRTTWCDAV